MRKKAIRSLALLIIGFVLFMANTALAQGNLSMRAKISPEELIGPGKVTISLNFTNNGSSDVYGIKLNIDDNPKQYSFTDIPAGQKKTFSLKNIEINEYQIGSSLDLNVRYFEDEQLYTTSYKLPIKQKVAQADYSLTHDASTTSAAKDEEVTLIYTIDNFGDVDLQSLSISDPAAGGNVLADFYLEAGKKHTVTKKMKFNKAIVSKPISQATANGENLTREAEPISISITEPFLDVIVVKKGADDSGTSLEITVKNSGNIPMHNITITDDTGVVLGDNVSIAVGASHVITHKVSAQTSSRSFVVTAIGSIGSNAQPLTFKSETMKLDPIITKEDIKLTMTSQPSNTNVDEGTEIEIKVAIKLDSPIPLQNAVIYEQSAGDILKVGTLPIGESQFSVKLRFNDTSDLRLSIRADDQNGEKHTADSAAVTINVTAKPTPSISPSDNAQGTESESPSILMWVMIGLGALLIFAVIALVLVFIQERKKKAKKREEAEIEEILRREQIAKRSQYGREQPKQSDPALPRRTIPPQQNDFNPISNQRLDRNLGQLDESVVKDPYNAYHKDDTAKIPVAPSAPSQEVLPKIKPSVSVERRPNLKPREMVQPPRRKEESEWYKESYKDVYDLFEKEFNNNDNK